MDNYVGGVRRCLMLVTMDANLPVRPLGSDDGLFTRADAYRSGLSPWQVRRRVLEGRWQQVGGDVFALSGLELTSEHLDRAAQLTVPGSILAGPSAARRWRMPVPPGPPYLLVPPHHGRPRLPVGRLLYASVDRVDVGNVAGARTTWRERTVFDCLRLLDEVAAADLLDRALHHRWITADTLSARLLRHTGCTGIQQVIRLSRQIADGTRSVAERRLARLLRQARITGWRGNVPIADGAGTIGVGDIVFDRRRVVIEVDGWAYHTTPDRFQRDRDRQNRLVAAGWTVLRFTWRDLTEREDHVIAAILAVLAAPGQP